MSVVNQIKESAAAAIKELYNVEIKAGDITVNATKPEFEGDYTIVIFSLVKQLRKAPDAAGNELGNYLTEKHAELFASFNVIKGFLNLVVADSWWINFLAANYNNTSFGHKPKNGQKVMVEYSSPNTNKPLHLGHLRNNFLGWSTAAILNADGYDIVKTCIVNDRGIHICKSMIAWQMFGNGATPESTGTKGDHFVGDYYVKFNDVYKKETGEILNGIKFNTSLSLFNEKEIEQLDIYASNIVQFESLQKKIISETNFEEIKKIHLKVGENIDSAIGAAIKWRSIQKIFDSSEFEYLSSTEKEKKQKEVQKVLKPIITVEEKIDVEKEKLEDLAGSKTKIMKAAQQMLIDWEAGKPEVIDLWKRMNSWVYKGFDETYKRIGSDFDKVYYESETYLLGKDLVEEGLAKGVFRQKEDSSVWIDLTADGLDEKIVRRKDGTAVYITQDIGLVVNKYEEYKCDQSIYVVGDEQNYHFKVLKLIAQKLGLPSADGIYHLSYGMVELPTGKMKSREGTVVDADDITDEMISIAKQKTKELGKVKDFTETELKELYDTIGLGALKFFLLRVDPKKRMIFNPEESIDFHGFTGPFVQYTHARIKSILRKLPVSSFGFPVSGNLLKLEKEVVIILEQFDSVITESSTEHDPSKLAIYIFNLAKVFNSFYTEHSIANAESDEKKGLRLQLAQLTAHTIKTAMQLLGIKVPERM